MRPLDGIKVLDLSRVLAGPYCTMIMADYGAEIIKVEMPETGDDSRSFGPYRNGDSMYYANINRGKKSMTLNMKHPEAKKIIFELVKQVDVVVENFRPGTMEKLGLGYDVLKEINPKIIYGVSSGFGHTGPWSKKPAYDLVIQALSGFMSITGPEGGEPTKSGPSIMDLLSGILLAKGIFAALFVRERHGIGQKVDVAMLDGGISILENGILRFLCNGENPGPVGNRHASITPFESFQGGDGGHFVIAVGNDNLWAKFCKLIKHEELTSDERFVSNLARTINQKQLKTIISGIFAIQPTEYWLKAFDGAGIPAAPINNMEQVCANEQAIARDMFVDVVHPIIGQHTIIGPAVKFTETPAAITAPAPTLGQHTAEILRQYLGYSDAVIEQLINNKAV